MNGSLLEFLGVEFREAVAWSLAGLFLGVLGWRERSAAAERARDAEDVEYDVKGLRWWSPRDERDLILVDEGQPYAGWVCYQSPKGSWILLREANAVDFEESARSRVGEGMGP